MPAHPARARPVTVKIIPTDIPKPIKKSQSTNRHRGFLSWCYDGHHTIPARRRRQRRRRPARHPLRLSHWQPRGRSGPPQGSQAGWHGRFDICCPGPASPQPFSAPPAVPRTLAHRPARARRGGRAAATASVQFASQDGHAGAPHHGADPGRITSEIPCVPAVHHRRVHRHRHRPRLRIRPRLRLRLRPHGGPVLRVPQPPLARPSQPQPSAAVADAVSQSHHHGARSTGGVQRGAPNNTPAQARRQPRWCCTTSDPYRAGPAPVAPGAACQRPRRPRHRVFLCPRLRPLPHPRRNRAGDPRAVPPRPHGTHGRLWPGGKRGRGARGPRGGWGRRGARPRGPGRPARKRRRRRSPGRAPRSPRDVPPGPGARR